MNTLFSKTMNILLCSGLLCLGSSLGAMNFNTQQRGDERRKSINPQVMAFFGLVPESKGLHRGDAQRLSLLRDSLSKEKIEAIINDVFRQLRTEGPLTGNEIRQIAEKHGVIIGPGQYSRTHFPSVVLHIPPATVLLKIRPDSLEEALKYALKGELCGEVLESFLGGGDVWKQSNFVQQYFEPDCFTRHLKKRSLPGEDSLVFPKRVKELEEKIVKPTPQQFQHQDFIQNGNEYNNQILGLIGSENSQIPQVPVGFEQDLSEEKSIDDTFKKDNDDPQDTLNIFGLPNTLEGLSGNLLNYLNEQ